MLMEVCQRTESDKKGGHLARDKETAKLVLRAQARGSLGGVGSSLSSLASLLYKHAPHFPPPENHPANSRGLVPAQVSGDSFPRWGGGVQV